MTGPAEQGRVENGPATSGPLGDGGSRLTDRRLRTSADLDGIAFDDQGLVPVVAQDAKRGNVLMVAWASQEALERSLETGFLHFWSRSRGELWKKGETSGNTQRLVSLHTDCDADTLLARVEPAGPACHTGESTCFGLGTVNDRGDADAVLSELWSVLEDRANERPEGSYTVRLLEDENLRLKKLGEETAELIAALARGDERVPEEAADLLYHLLVAVKGADRSWSDVVNELAARRG